MIDLNLCLSYHLCFNVLEEELVQSGKKVCVVINVSQCNTTEPGNTLQNLVPPKCGSKISVLR